MNEPVAKSEKPQSRIKAFFSTLVVLVLTLLTIVLLFVTFSLGGWWILLCVVWLPPFYIVCAWLGHPVEKDDGHSGPDFIDH